MAQATGARTSAAAAGDGPGPTPPIAAPEPRQRWRLTFARDELPSDRVGRSLLEDWHDALHASGLPIVIQDGDSNRPRLAFAAPLPAAARGDAELADIWLLERVPLWRFRESLESRLPVGHRWLAAEDVWLGAPPLPAQVSGAEWRIEIAPLGGSVALVAEAARNLLEAASIPRVRDKGGSSRSYDLRPLLGSIVVEARRDDTLRVVTRFDAALGAGRPEEIAAALAEVSGIAIDVRTLTRERLILNDPSASPKGGSRRRRTTRD